MRERIAQWHDEYCSRLEAVTAALGAPVPPRPKCVVQNHLRKSTRSGEYDPRARECRYALAYALTAGDAYEATVAHEVVHHYQEWIAPGCAWHGELFAVLCRAVGRVPEERHKFSVKRARMVAQLLDARDYLTAQETEDVHTRLDQDRHAARDADSCRPTTDS